MAHPHSTSPGGAEHDRGGRRAAVHRQARSVELGDVRDTWADVSRARELIGYQPRQSLVEGLRREYEWVLHALGESLR